MKKVLGYFTFLVFNKIIKKGAEKMVVINHIKELKKKHHSLKIEISNAQKNPSFNTENISLMKKLKLKVKEQIYRMEARHN